MVSTCMRALAYVLSLQAAHGSVVCGEVKHENMQAPQVIGEEEASRVDRLEGANLRKRHGKRLEVRAGVVRNRLLTEYQNAAALHGDQSRGARLDRELCPRPVAKVLVAQVHLVRLQVDTLLDVFVEQRERWPGQSVQEHDVEHVQLLEPNVEGLGEQRAGRGRGYHLEQAVVQVQPDEPVVGFDDRDLASVCRPADPVRHVALGLRYNLGLGGVVREDAELVALGGQEEAVCVLARRLPELHRRDATVERHIVQQLQTLRLERVDLDPSAAAYDQVERVGAGEGRDARVRHGSRRLRRDDVIVGHLRAIARHNHSCEYNDAHKKSSHTSRVELHSKAHVPLADIMRQPAGVSRLPSASSSGCRASADRGRF